MKTAELAPAPSQPRAAATAASRLDAVWIPLVALVPGALTVYLAWESGGFFPGATAIATLALIVLMFARVLLADDPFEGVGTPLAVAAGALMLFAAWTLLSGAWSESSSRAMLEFDRVLLYLLALVFFGSFARSSRYGRWLVWGLATALVAICTAALITRTLPNVWSAPAGIQNNRLSYPIGYWNALGLAASLALVLCLHLTSSARESRPVRILAAAVCPILGATLLFTFSRGPMVVAVVGIVVYMAVGRPRLLLTGFLAAAPATAAAVIVAYDADLLAEFVKGRGYRFTSAAVDQGHDVALAVGLCVVGAALVRGLGILTADSYLAHLRLRRRTRRRLAIAGAALLVTAAVIGSVAATRNGWIDRQYDRLVHDPVTQTGDYRDRLFNPGLSRMDRWRVARDGFSAHPIDGSGAGTYRLVWERNRPTSSQTNDAHSLYLEVLAELGIVGGLLLAVALLTILGGTALRTRSRNGTLYAALLGAGITWAIHAALDWDWELPAVTLWLFAAGGIALALPAGKAPRRKLGWPVRLAVVAGLVLFAITPVRVAISQARLSDSVSAYASGRCDEAIRSANKSISVLGNRPEPYEVLGYCEARLRQGDHGLAAMKKAVQQDPRNWEYHYGLALLRAAVGKDPRREAAVAYYRNPREPLTQAALVRFHSRSPRVWRRAARRLGLSPNGACRGGPGTLSTPGAQPCR